MVTIKELMEKARSKPTTIKDINDKYDYDNERPEGNGDSPKVACGQDGTYNELQYIYDTYLKPKIDDRTITKQQAINALDSACSKLSNPRARKEFYIHLEKQLGIEI